MKKIIYSMIAMLSLSLGFTACSSDDDDDMNSNVIISPEKVVEGTYEGTFTRIQTNSATAAPESAAGTMIFIPSDTTSNVALMKVLCETQNLNESVPVNVTYSKNDIIFFNQSSTNKMKYVTGGADSHGNITFTFEISLRSGRSTKPYRYTFEGEMTGKATQ